MSNAVGRIAEVDLTNCDREPIHIPGSIQPFGFLIAASADWVINRAANTERFLGTRPSALIGRPLREVVLPQALRQIRGRVAMLRATDAVERLFSIPLIEDRPPFDLAVHCSGSAIIIECEPARGDEIEVSSLVRGMLSRLGVKQSVEATLREGARQLRMLTGFDRVMVYRFAADGSGEVAAEALARGIDSFLGLHFPPTDIPRQARALYLRNIFRIIADVEAAPVAVEPADEDDPLDLSLSLLRSVSPIHIEYLRNMGVSASMSVSIIIDGRLWGLFACHHYSPRLPSFAERSAAELFGQMFSLMLESRLRSEIIAYEDRARKVASQLMAAAAQDSELLKDAEWMGDLMLDTIPADGVGVSINGALTLTGMTPDDAAFRRIVDFLNEQQPNGIYATDRISEVLPEASSYSHVSAGMLAIPVSRLPRDYVVLFRSEQLRSVRWAGDQDKSIEHGPHGPRLTPRKSFEEWSELVRGEALPFSEAEISVAEALRTTLLEVVLRLTETAHEERRRANEQQKLLIAELNHRVRNILALIRALVGQTRRSATDVKSFTATLDARLQSLARAHDQLTADQWGPASLKELIVTEFSVHLADRVSAVRLDGPDVHISPDAFTVMALVIHELVTNASKYGALSDRGQVTIAWSLDVKGGLNLEWTESGGPAVLPPSRRGFGTTIIENSIPHELGGTSSIEYRTAGIHARFTLPARYVSEAPESDNERQKGDFPETGADALKGKTVLLLEDSTLIALDAEDKLIELGAAHVELAASNDAAARLIAEGVDLAVLDFNLNRENSVPTADLLRERGIPFIFASGYGGDSTIPGRFDAVPVVVKPYTKDDLSHAFASMAPGSR